jgi:hypothetical protein
MADQIILKIDADSAMVLKKCKGKKLMKIGYAFEMNFSIHTILIFDSFTVKLTNTPTVSCGEEYPKLSAEFVKVIDNIAYNNKEYEYIDAKMTVNNIELMTDEAHWVYENENECIILQNGLVLSVNTDKQIVFYAANTLAGAIIIYTKRTEFEANEPVENIWPIDEETPVENMIYKRTFEAL